MQHSDGTPMGYIGTPQYRADRAAAREARSMQRTAALHGRARGEGSFSDVAAPMVTTETTAHRGGRLMLDTRRKRTADVAVRHAARERLQRRATMALARSAERARRAALVVTEAPLAPLAALVDDVQRGYLPRSTERVADRVMLRDATGNVRHHCTLHAPGYMVQLERLHRYMRQQTASYTALMQVEPHGEGRGQVTDRSGAQVNGTETRTALRWQGTPRWHVRGEGGRVLDWRCYRVAADGTREPIETAADKRNAAARERRAMLAAQQALLDAVVAAAQSADAAANAAALADGTA